MENIAVFVNDVAAARRILQPVRVSEGPKRWLLVACPPKLTRHIGRWVTHRARLQWRERWAADLFDALRPELDARAGSEVETLIANQPLVDVAARLLVQLPALRLLDARQPRPGRVDEPISAAQTTPASSRWRAPVGAAAGLSLVLALAD